MSTRSGKRIHKSLHENVTQDDELNGERKTRSRLLKDNLDNLNISYPKIRKNYVQYPSTDEEPSQEAGLKPVRTLRHHTLKEITIDKNLVENCQEIPTDTDINSKPTRLTRKTKKLAQDEPLVDNNFEMQIVELKKGKKGKKKTEKAPNEETAHEKENALDEELENNTTKAKKSKNKKLKKDNEKNKNKTNSLNNTTSSLDSFHSAAGSPLKRNETTLKDSNTDIVDEIKSNSQENLENKKLKQNKKSSKTNTKKGLQPVDTATKINIYNVSGNHTEKDSMKCDLNGTFDIEPESTLPTSKNEEPPAKKKNKTSSKPLDATFEKETDIINTTFDKDPKNSKDIINLTFDKSSDSVMKISLTSDDSKSSAENILNTTPVLIESSMDCTKTPEEIPERVTRSKVENTIITPLKREGTFTKDGPDPIIIMSPKPKASVDLTPSKRRMSMPSPGRTPYHSGGKVENRSKNIMNRTRSIEKPKRRSSLETTRTTKVMFCSPANNGVLASQRKSRVIKSSMKGSTKSFIFDDNGLNSDRLSRKRSLTANDADESRSKRTRLADDLQESVDRLSRPRHSTCMPKLPTVTPTKKPQTPSKCKSDGKGARSKLPNFAALHQKQFAKMESLDECQERKAKRALRLLAPTGGVNVLERNSPKVPQDPKSASKEETNKKFLNVTKSATETKQYTRFGFKLNLDVNPFSIPSTNKKEKTTTEKSEKIPLLKRPNGITRSVTQYSIKKLPKTTLPSVNGATTTRKEEAKQVILREKPSNVLKEKSASKRLENRTIIKGVRTNRRFELQMRSRNI